MKKLKLIIPIILTVMVFFASCSKDKKEVAPTPTPTPTPIVSNAIVDVYNPITGKTWMDRNLGASRVATSSTDAASYGNLYQWGRGADGHEKRNSSTTFTLSTTDAPGHSDFILSNNPPYDWRNPQNSNLWQGVNGINNPCPAGYRLPTEAELQAEVLSWATNDAMGAFGSPLKLTVAGYRNSVVTVPVEEGNIGRYWCSTPSFGSSSYSLQFDVNGAGTYPGSGRTLGACIRCIKE